MFFIGEFVDFLFLKIKKEKARVKKRRQYYLEFLAFFNLNEKEIKVSGF
jgi:hypothetical protein